MHCAPQFDHERRGPPRHHWLAVLNRICDLQVAIKFVERGGGITKNVVREILNHRLCSLHPHIIQVRRAGFLSAPCQTQPQLVPSPPRLSSAPQRQGL